MEAETQMADLDLGTFRARGDFDPTPCRNLPIFSLNAVRIQCNCNCKPNLTILLVEDAPFERKGRRYTDTEDRSGVWISSCHQRALRQVDLSPVCFLVWEGWPEYLRHHYIQMKMRPDCDKICHIGYVYYKTTGSSERLAHTGAATSGRPKGGDWFVPNCERSCPGGLAAFEGP